MWRRCSRKMRGALRCWIVICLTSRIRCSTRRFKTLPLEEFGPYRIKRVLGEGGMGVVYLAEREDLGSLVAIKVLRDAWLSPARLARFESEQRTLANLNHPSIARLYDADCLENGTPWFVMEYVDGAPLTDYCRTARMLHRRAPAVVPLPCARPFNTPTRRRSFIAT